MEVYIHMWKNSNPMYCNFSYDTLFKIWMVVCKQDWNNVCIILPMPLSCKCLDPP